MDTLSLTEQYVRQVVRRLPADQREDVAAELHGSIADTLDARAPDAPASAEREVLTEMGDPARLASDYSDRPSVLIGPGLYPTYKRLLLALLSAVVPVVTVALVALAVLDGEDLGSVIGTGVGTAVTVGAQVIAWVTVVFALVERSHKTTGPRTAGWTPDDLPVPQRADRGGVASGIWATWNALLIGLIVWQHTARPYWAVDADGRIERLEILEPGLWSGWIWPMLAGLTAVVAIELARIAMRGWTFRLVCWYAAAEVLFVVPFVWVVQQQMLFDPAFLTDFNGDWQTPDEFYTVLALGALAMSATMVFRRFRAARAQGVGR